MPSEPSFFDDIFKAPLGDDLPPYNPGSNATNAYEKDIKVDSAIQAIVESEDTKQALRNAVNDLKDSAYIVERNFRKVGQGLDAAAKITPIFRPALSAFRENWSSYHKEYIRLLWQSRVVAGHARATANDFAGDFIEMLNDDNVSLAEKKEEVQGYREQLLEDQQKASGISQGFTELQSNIAVFHGDITRWMETNSITKVKDEIYQILFEILETQKQIKALTRQIVTGAVGAVAMGGCAAALTAIGIICPLLWVGAALSGAYAWQGSTKVWGEIKKKQAQENMLKGKHIELETKQSILDGLTKVQPILKPLTDDIASISERLVIFATVWSCIHADLVEIEQTMQKAQDSKTKLLFKRRLQTVSKVYKLFNKALYQYETAVHKEEIYLGN